MKQIPIGFQLYAVRGEFAQNVPRTLETLRQIGYKGVEFWGYEGTSNVYQNYSAAGLKGLLEKNGLECCGMHIELSALAPEAFTRTLENARLLACPSLTVAGAKEKMTTEEGTKGFALCLNKAASLARPKGVTVGYHAHPFDFKMIHGVSAWERLFDSTDGEVRMQMDVANCLNGGGDPLALLKKFANRVQTIHLREHPEKLFHSEYYKEIFGLCEANPKLEWFIVEMGGPEGHGFELPRQVMEKLRHIGVARQYLK